MSATQTPVKFRPVKLPVKFGGVSFDDETASIGIKIDLATINDNKEQAVADLYRWICNRHVKAQLIPGKRDDDDKQQKLVDSDLNVTAEFDTNSNSTNHKTISNRLSVPIAAIDVRDFQKLAKREGKLHILSVMEQIDLGDDDEDDPDKNDDDRPIIKDEKKAKAK